MFIVHETKEKWKNNTMHMYKISSSLIWQWLFFFLKYIIMHLLLKNIFEWNFILKL